ncbi:hypothetical protein D3C80_1825780 [compost metagenome]
MRGIASGVAVAANLFNHALQLVRMQRCPICFVTRMPQGREDFLALSLGAKRQVTAPEGRSQHRGTGSKDPEVRGDTVALVGSIDTQHGGAITHPQVCWPGDAALQRCAGLRRQFGKARMPDRRGA